MTQARRDSPRIPYDEAICLARIDGKGRVYGRGVDLSASGLSLVSTESCPIGTEIKCDVLLPHGPRSVTGKIVRVTAAPGGFELAVTFGEIKPAVAAVIENLIAARTKQALPAKLRIDGVDKPLRCEAQVDEQMVRLTATLPFLRLDGGVDVLLGEQGAVAAAGTIRRISVDPSTTDGFPRLALDVTLDDEKRTRTKRYGTPRVEDLETAPVSPRLPPTNLPPPCGHPLALGGGRGGALPRRAGGRGAAAPAAGARHRRDHAAPGSDGLGLASGGGHGDRQPARLGHPHRAADHLADGRPVLEGLVGRRARGPGAGRHHRPSALQPLGLGPAPDRPQIEGMFAERTARPGEINYPPFDRYSPLHGLVGVAAGLIGLGFWPTFGIAVAWEIVEHVFKNLVPSVFAYPTQDTLANSVGDVLSALFGWALATAARRQRELRRFG